MSALLAMAPQSLLAPGIPLDVNAWISPALAVLAGAQITYVSSSVGNNTWDGTAPAFVSGTTGPKASIASALASGRMRTGFPDQLLLKSGDTWTDDPFAYLQLSGRSFYAPMVIGSYGSGAKPIIKFPHTGQGVGIGALGGTQPGLDFVIVANLDFYAYTRDPANGSYAGTTTDSIGIRHLSPITYFMLAGCTFRYCSNNITIDASSTGPTSTVVLYRNSILNAWSNNINSQGAYVAGISNIVVLQNVSDHNGWNEANGSGATALNHNYYFQGSSAQRSILQFKQNISARSASDGCLSRNGGIIDGNLFVKNAIGPIIGVEPGDEGAGIAVPTATVGSITNNVILEATDIKSLPSPQPRSEGPVISNALGAGIVISGNIIANPDPGALTGNQFGIVLSSDVSGVVATGNIIFGMNGAINDSGTGNTTTGNAINQAGYANPSVSVEAYCSSVLGGSATLADFLARVAAFDPTNPNSALLAPAINAYVKAGFT